MFVYFLISLLILLFVCFQIIFPIIGFLQKRWRMHRLTSKMPGPNGYPIVGSGLMFLFRDSHSIFAEIQKQLSIYQSPAKLWFGPLLCILIDNPQDLQTVLNSPDCLEKSLVYKFFNCPLGLFSSPAHLWKLHRRQLNQCFSMKTLQSYMGTLNSKAKRTVQDLHSHINGPEFDIMRYMATTSLAMILSTNLQTDVDVQNHLGAEIFEGMEGLAGSINARIFSVIKHPEWLYKLSAESRNEAQNWVKFNKVFDLIKRNESMKKSLQTEDDLWPYMKRLKTSQANTPELFTDEAVRDEIITILAGGTETSTLTLAFVVLMLAMYPDIQEKVYNEIQGCNVDEPSWETLNQLTYMEMVIKETMRIFSPGPILGRQATADVELEHYTIPNGAQLIISVYSVHRSPKWWTKPNEFYPEHFNVANSEGRHPFAFIPFSAGPRNCIGIKYGWMSMKITLWHLVRNYKFATHLNWDDLKLELNITLKLKNKHFVSIKKRKT